MIFYIYQIHILLVIQYFHFSITQVQNEVYMEECHEVANGAVMLFLSLFLHYFYRENHSPCSYLFSCWRECDLI